jgi:hypothetical protein
MIHPSVPGGQVEVAVTWMDLEDGYDYLTVRAPEMLPEPCIPFIKPFALCTVRWGGLSLTR